MSVHYSKIVVVIVAYALNTRYVVWSVKYYWKSIVNDRLTYGEFIMFPLFCYSVVKSLRLGVFFACYYLVDWVLTSILEEIKANPFFQELWDCTFRIEAQNGDEPLSLAWIYKEQLPRKKPETNEEHYAELRYKWFTHARLACYEEKDSFVF